MNEFIVIEEKAFREVSEQEARKYAEECVRREGLSQVLYRRVDAIRQVQEPVFSWDSKQSAQAEHDAEWVPVVGETVEVLGWGYADNVDKNWRSAKVVRVSPIKGGNHTVIFIDGSNSGDKVRRSIKDRDMRRPSVKPSENPFFSKKPFVFGERVLCGETYSGINYNWCPGVVVKFKPNDRVCVWPEGSADWFVFEKDQLKHIE